jgi:hypothetical protein
VATRPCRLMVQLRQATDRSSGFPARAHPAKVSNEQPPADHYPPGAFRCAQLTTAGPPRLSDSSAKIPWKKPHHHCNYQHRSRAGKPELLKRSNPRPPLHSNPFQSIPIHSNPFQSIPIHSNPFQSIPIHSNPFVSIRVHSWLNTPLHSCPFVFIRGSKTPLHSCPFVVQNTPPFLVAITG